MIYFILFFFFSSRRRHTRLTCDWSSDVCSSDLEILVVRTRRDSARCPQAHPPPPAPRRSRPGVKDLTVRTGPGRWCRTSPAPTREIGRASCRERVEISVVAGSLKKKKEKKREVG